MRKYYFSLCVALLWGMSSVLAQKTFRGSITYKPVYGGNKDTIKKVKKRFYYDITITTNGRMFRETYTHAADGWSTILTDIIYGAGEHQYLLINRREKEARLHYYRKKPKKPAPKMRQKKTGKKKLIAGLPAYEVLFYDEGNNTPALAAWVSSQFAWKFREHPHYEISHPLFTDSMTYLKNRVVLGVRFYHESHKAWVDIVAYKINHQLTKNTFALPKGS